MLYIPDEPTTGLHFTTSVPLLKVLLPACYYGKCLLTWVTEYNLDDKNCDRLIDIFSGQGSRAAAGCWWRVRPEVIAAHPESHTGATSSPAGRLIPALQGVRRRLRPRLERGSPRALSPPGGEHPALATPP